MKMHSSHLGILHEMVPIIHTSPSVPLNFQPNLDVAHCTKGFNIALASTALKCSECENKDDWKNQKESIWQRLHERFGTHIVFVCFV